MDGTSNHRLRPWTVRFRQFLCVVAKQRHRRSRARSLEIPTVTSSNAHKIIADMVLQTEAVNDTLLVG